MLYFHFLLYLKRDTTWLFVLEKNNNAFGDKRSFQCTCKQLFYQTEIKTFVAEFFIMFKGNK